MRLKYIANTSVANMPVFKHYYLKTEFIKNNVNNVAKYFINQRKKCADLRLLIDYKADNKDYLNIYLVDWWSLAYYEQSGWLNGYFTDNAIKVYKPKNIKKVLVSFADKRVKNGVIY